MCKNDISRYANRNREDLAGEHPFGDSGQIIIFFLFMSVRITDSFFFHYSTFLNNYIPSSVHITLGIIILIFSGYLAWAGLTTVFGKVREKPHVIRENVFRILRHPIYMSEILLYLGMLILSASISALVIWIIAIVFLHYISRYEEKIMLKKYQKEYEQYMREVPMYFPRIRRKREIPLNR